MMSRTRATVFLWALPAVKLLLHLFTYRGYGYFRDEFYYIACSRRLAFGYVDQPPLSILFLRGARALFGESLLAIRLLPAVAGALTVLLVGLMARALGGGRFAQALAMIAALAAPVYLGADHYYSMNAFDLLVWALAAYLLIRIFRGDSPRLWIVLGIVLGLGLLNKISVLWLGFGILAGLVLTSRRRLLLTPWPWAAGGLAAILFLPHVVWQRANGWPTVEFIHNATAGKMAAVSPLGYLLEQIRIMNPVAAPIWIAGLAYLLFFREGRSFRPLGWTYLTVLVVLLLPGTSRGGYLAPAYTWLLAAGGVAFDDLCARRRLPGLKGLTVALVFASGVALAPLALPILPVETYIRYTRALGFAPSTDERKEVAALPQWYADMHGWESIVETVAGVYESLPPEDRARAAIFAPDYGVAGAIDFLGRDRGLPEALCGHNNYWFWGPRGRTGEVVIIVGGSEEELSRLFASVERGATIECGYCMPYENHQPVWIARMLRRPLAEIWGELKHYD